MSSRGRAIRSVVWLTVFLCLASSGWAQQGAELREKARERLEAGRGELETWREAQTEEKLRMLRELEALEETIVAKREAVVDLRNETDALEREKRAVEEAGAESARQWEEIRGFVESYREEQANSLPLAEWAAGLTGTPDEESGASLSSESERWREFLTWSRERLAEKASGGREIDGSAIGEGGERLEGKWKVLGPTMIFQGSEGRMGKGVSEQDSLWPQLSSALGDDLLATWWRGEGGLLPLDPTGGEADRLVAQKTLLMRIQEGGPVMVPILGLGFIALILFFYKAFALRRIKLPQETTVGEIAGLWAQGKAPEARKVAEPFGWPMAGLLLAISEGRHGDRALMEEILYEKVLRARPFLERGLPFLALTAATAPLLGLLGTVTGMIQTFDMIAIFGTGDPGVLSGGISEALVTTQFGLIVAVPALLAHAFLQRRVKAVQANMEEVSIRLLNGLEEEEFFSHGKDVTGK
ncbi:MAG: MotA/TolQ/ExbB proton channel family protein [Opitutales bacterium]|nr:MotA/TolQ/ExbB proton channel family protein [Opitutales bacterium]